MRDNPKTKPNHIFTIVCISIVFFLIGVIGLVLIHSNKFLRLLENNLVAMVELEEGLAPSELQSIQLQLNSNGLIETNSVQFVSKEDAQDIMQEELGEDAVIPGHNPFFDAFTFKIKEVNKDQESLRRLKEEVTGNPGVLNFHFPEKIANQFSGFIRNFIFVSIGIVVLFLLLGIYLIVNTIKLSLYANRFLIKNMQIVGAPWQFIRKPFIQSGLVNGLISSLIALFLLGVLLFLCQSYFPQVKQVLDIGWIVVLMAVLLVACLVTCWISTKVGVDYYLKQKLEKLY